MRLAVFLLTGTLAATAGNKRPAEAAVARQAYLQRIHATMHSAPVATGSLWNPNGAFANLATDAKARSAGDLITIVISESTNSSSSGDLKASRNGSASAQVSKLGMKLSPSNALQNLYEATSNADLHGQGASTFSNSLETLLSATVLEVLPNGVMVVEGTRYLDIQHERQMVTIRGLVRCIDVRPDNTVLSGSLADLEIEVHGKGTVADFTRPVQPVFRFILRWLGI